MPVDRRIVSALPKRRTYSDVEAMISLSADLANGGEAKAVREYSRIWSWRRDRVKRFLDEHLCGKSDDLGGEPQNFTLYADVRRSAGHLTSVPPTVPPPGPRNNHGPRGVTRFGGPLSGATKRATTGETQRDKKKNKTVQPWAGLSRNLDALLASRDYLARLACASPVLAAWTLDEIAAWARDVVANGERKRQERRERAITSYAHFLLQCVSRVQPYERPSGVQSAPVEIASVTAALEGMRL